MKYGRSSSVVPPIRRKRLTVNFIEDEAKQKWTELTDVNFSSYSENEGKHRINYNFLQVCALPLVVFVKATQKGFSDFTDMEALGFAGVQEITTLEEDVQDSVFPPPLFIDDDRILQEHTIQDLKNRHKLYDPLEEGCENTRLFRPSLSLRRQSLESNWHVKIKLRDLLAKILSIGLPTIKITESTSPRAKRTTSRKGLYQTLAQLTAAGEGRGKKRVFCVDLPLNGILTT